MGRGWWRGHRKDEEKEETACERRRRSDLGGVVQIGATEMRRRDEARKLSGGETRETERARELETVVRRTRCTRLIIPPCLSHVCA